MKFIFITFTSIFILLTLSTFNIEKSDSHPMERGMPKLGDSVLRHVVLFKFKEGTSTADIKKVEEAFAALPAKIPQILHYEWGLNNSPEGLDKGFTHCFLLSFKNAEDRAVYLPHPDHKAFGQVLSPYLADVLVIDYWSK